MRETIVVRVVDVKTEKTHHKRPKYGRSGPLETAEGVNYLCTVQDHHGRSWIYKVTNNSPLYDAGRRDMLFSMILRFRAETSGDRVTGVVAPETIFSPRGNFDPLWMKIADVRSGGAWAFISRHEKAWNWAKDSFQTHADMTEKPAKEEKMSNSSISSLKPRVSDQPTMEMKKEVTPMKKSRRRHPNVIVQKIRGFHDPRVNVYSRSTGEILGVISKLPTGGWEAAVRGGRIEMQSKTFYFKYQAIGHLAGYATVPTQLDTTVPKIVPKPVYRLKMSGVTTEPIQAIKAIREATGMSLKYAKDAFDQRDLDYVFSRMETVTELALKLAAIGLKTSVETVNQ